MKQGEWKGTQQPAHLHALPVELLFLEEVHKFALEEHQRGLPSLPIFVVIILIIICPSPLVQCQLHRQHRKEGATRCEADGGPGVEGDGVTQERVFAPAT
jgi:hypothetical protein